MKKTLLWATVLAAATTLGILSLSGCRERRFSESSVKDVTLTTFAGEDILARHQAFRKEIAANPAAAQNYLKDQDAEIRRFALYTLIKN
ncbi:MAG: hypothetical protein IKR81_16990, partial [Victivallales bacterium]|nr:hypothetical protein [Victivallales bacterium]